MEDNKTHPKMIAIIAFFFFALAFTSAEAEGSSLANRSLLAVVGTDADDVLFGTKENNVLDGGIGDDWLFGDAGDDKYYFSSGEGKDTIVNLSTSPNEIDTLTIAGVTHSEIWFYAFGDDLRIAIEGSASQVTIDSWFLSPNNQLDKIEVGKRSISDKNINALTQIMSSYAVTVGIGNRIPEDIKRVLSTSVDAYWN